jgi:predicted nucleic acid-binding protein
MQPALFDSSIYIAALRTEGDAVLSLRRLAPQAPLWLSAVVLEELYAGVARRDRRVVERLEQEFERLQRILVPNLSDWSHAGRVLARFGMEYGYEEIGKGRLTNDALIALSAARQGITVITANARDFARLARFRPFRFEVATVEQSRRSEGET